MNYLITELSKHENRLIEEAPKEYGSIFENAHDLIFLTGNFIDRISPDGFVFSLFLPQVQKALTLSLLSCLRNHNVQFNMLLRYALESAVLAGYALKNINIDDFCFTDQQNCLYPKEKVKTKAYKWIEKDYPGYSEKIKFMKDTINESFAHANILSTSDNFNFYGKVIKSEFFDKVDPLFTKQGLWWLADVSFGFLNFFFEVNQKYSLITFQHDFPIKMKKYGIKNEEIKSQLMEHSRFKKWME